MHRNHSRSLAFVAFIALQALAAIAHAQSATTGGSAGSQGQTDIAAPPAQVTSSAAAIASTQATADLTRLRGRIIDKATDVSSRAKSKAEARLTASAQRVDDLVNQQGDAAVATRLATEFGLATEVLSKERQSFTASWGDVMIAHTLSSNVGGDVSAAQLLAIRTQGMGWGQMAAGLGLDLGSAVSSVNAESRVASGLARADGKVAMIRGEGARAGVGIDAGLRGGVDAGPAGAGVNTGAGLGVQIGK